MIGLSCWYCRIETVDMKSSSGRAKIVGTLVCVGGALMLTLYRGRPFFNTSHSQAVISMHDHATKLSSANKTQNWTIGLICLVLGTLLWSLWFLLQSKIGKRYPCQYSSTAIMCSFGSIQSAALSFVTSRSLSIWVLRGRTEVFTVLFAVSMTSFGDKTKPQEIYAVALHSISPGL